MQGHGCRRSSRHEYSGEAGLDYTCSQQWLLVFFLREEEEEEEEEKEMSQHRGGEE